VVDSSEGYAGLGRGEGGHRKTGSGSIRGNCSSSSRETGQKDRVALNKNCTSIT
jgi:hypothetical protein